MDLCPLGCSYGREVTIHILKAQVQLSTPVFSRVAKTIIVGMLWAKKLFAPSGTETYFLDL